jgi:hypothetical protein
MENSNTLSSAVAAKFKLVGLPAQKVRLPNRFGGETVDFRTMTVEKAEALIQLAKDKKIDGGFPYLQPKSGSGSSGSK